MNPNGGFYKVNTINIYYICFITNNNNASIVVDEIKMKRLEFLVYLWGKQEALGKMVHYTTIGKGLKI